MSRCKHGLESGCLDCRPTRSLVRPDGIGEILNPDWARLFESATSGEGIGPWITAQYDGICRGCGYRWVAGEDLIRYAESEDGYVCESCGSG